MVFGYYKFVVSVKGKTSIKHIFLSQKLNFSFGNFCSTKIRIYLSFEFINITFHARRIIIAPHK